MMYHMTITRKDAANAEVVERRDAIGARSANYLYADPVVAEALRRWAFAAEESLTRKAKKAGFKPLNSDFEYGLNGGASGPIELWVQKRFEE